MVREAGGEGKIHKGGGRRTPCVPPCPKDPFYLIITLNSCISALEKRVIDKLPLFCESEGDKVNLWTLYPDFGLESYFSRFNRQQMLVQIINPMSNGLTKQSSATQNGVVQKHLAIGPGETRMEHALQHPSQMYTKVHTNDVLPKASAIVTRTATLDVPLSHWTKDSKFSVFRSSVKWMIILIYRHWSSNFKISKDPKSSSSTIPTCYE